MEFLNEGLAWAWARHHNILSWYIRPLFIVPFCYAAYKRSPPGMALTVAALATSMFWFPAPETPDPMALQFLEAERAWLTGEWGVWKSLLSLTIPAFFILLGAAFWKRSWGYGLAVINAAMLGKVWWSLAYGGESGRAILPPALLGLAVCNACVLLAVRWIAKRTVRPDARTQHKR
jgi:hypothetical protein